ncbi:transcriptional repressor ctcf-like [Moniliophthora roreri MCA 2997]|uniref:Transcriptional repressor ctcf-like n=2 Tax=Moniliophthora roreri TaxID=221103 RepID=V2YBC0_MONRO|nr:transcriptional repressor ctcf-like [Moniliophthora roreri MCA 2997]KAI3602258.1 transcriptional repressor ctcf-like [Moniliophthora roreri]
MPRVKSEKRSTEPRGSSQCTICNVIISNKTDMPRHMKIHSENRDKLMHRCPYPGCKFENLQKSNVETHIRTHTKTKTERCPDCDFSTVDPGSLTRHRKRIHGYVPKTRRSRQPAPPRPPIVLPEAGPSTTQHLSSQQAQSPTHPNPPQTSFVQAYPDSHPLPQSQSRIHEHQLPQYNPQPVPPHHIQLPPIRYYQPRPTLTPSYYSSLSRSRSRSRSRSPSVVSGASSSDEESNQSSGSASIPGQRLRPVASWS